MANLMLVEDHALVRAGIRALLERLLPAHRIVAEAGNGLAAVNLARTFQPEIALLDVTMPELNGIETVRLIGEASPGTRCIMLSMHGDAAFVRAAMKAGAFGYILKDSAFQELEAAIRAALSGDKYVSPKAMAELKVTPTSEWGPDSTVLGKLTRRERQLLQLIGEAFSSPEIAAKLGLSVRTVETYRQNMMNKLGLHSVAALATFAVRHRVCHEDTPPNA